MGPLPPDVDAVFRATLTRSSGNPEELAAGYGIGYFHLVWSRGEGLSRNILGGSNALIDALGAGLGDRAHTGARVVAVAREGDEVAVRYAEEGSERTVRARAVVVATPAYVTREVVSG